jgi:hypothetical protein
MGIMLLEKIKSGKLGEESDSGCVVRVRNIRSMCDVKRGPHEWKNSNLPRDAPFLVST